MSNFWQTVTQGGLYPFYFYNPFNADPIGSNFDPTGTNVNGRVAVFFRGDWSQKTDLARHTGPSLLLVETADLVEAVQAGQGRTARAAALLEPATVLR